MTRELKAAIRFRAHADVLRFIADMDQPDGTRAALMRVANDYESLATEMEWMAEEKRRESAYEYRDEIPT